MVVRTQDWLWFAAVVDATGVRQVGWASGACASGVGKWGWCQWGGQGGLVQVGWARAVDARGVGASGEAKCGQ